MAEAIRYLHEDLKMVHRDLHSNWLVKDTDEIILTGFFSAKVLKDGFVPAGEKPCFCEAIAAPEQLAKEAYGFPSDIYQLAMQFAFMVNMGVLADPQKLSRTFGLDINSLLSQMLDSNPANRPSVSQVLDQLRTLQATYDEELSAPYKPKVETLFDLEVDVHRDLYKVWRGEAPFLVESPLGADAERGLRL